LNSEQAGVSPLAGYTVHPHGFCYGVSTAALEGLQQYFGRFQQMEQAMLNRQRLDCYTLQHSVSPSGLLSHCVVWDTPDFDSIDAADYREGLIRTIALADVIVLVVSKEKYADQSVWEVMKNLSSFQQPTLICLNKLSEGNEAGIVQSLQDKWRQYRSDPVPEIVPMLFQKQEQSPVWPQDTGQSLLKLAKKVAHSKHGQYQQQLLNHYWPQWLEPVFAEHYAQRHWQTMVEQVISQALKNYRRDYLDHPHHYETFQAALLNMLNLLEIPGFASAMSKTRRVMTWPMRKLFNLGKEGGNSSPVQELVVLNQLAEHVLIQLADKLLEKSETEAQPASWWKEMAVTLRQSRAGLLQNHALAVTAYQQSFQPDVQAAAQRLYSKLQEQPVVLNSLRATRLTTDTAGILLAIQAGGIGVHDLVLTPLMLSVTSVLAESAIGSYMGRVEAELKQHQFNTVKQQLFDKNLRPRLEALAQQALSQQRFNLSEAQCRQAEQALKEKKHGLRLL
jgi:hypothetical protein